MNKKIRTLKDSHRCLMIPLMMKITAYSIQQIKARKGNKQQMNPDNRDWDEEGAGAGMDGLCRDARDQSDSYQEKDNKKTAGEK